MERSVKAIIISSVRPEPTSGGQLVLYLHLYRQPGITADVYGAEPGRLTCSSIIRRLFGRLNQTRFNRIAQDVWTVWQGRWLDPHLPRDVNDDDSLVVLTVA